MAETDIGSAASSSDQHADYSVSAERLDSPATKGELTYINTNRAKYLGYYKSIPELKKAINTKATWTVGKGFTADEPTELLLGTIRGGGKDTFNTILEGMIRDYHISGDAFAEIIRDDDEVLINLKILNPEQIAIVVNDKGRIIRYEQLSRVKGKKNETFKPDRIFHLAKDRISDEIHGDGIIEVLEPIILARNEAMNDWKRVLKRNINPLWIFHMDTDDTGEIAAFKTKMDAARGSGENIYVPKGVIVPEIVTTAQNAMLNPLPTIEAYNQYFWQATGGTDIAVGATISITDGAAKIRYLAFQQSIEEEQLFIEEQVLAQLNLEIELEFPASLEGEALSERRKEGDGETAAEPNDTTTEMEGKT